MNLLINEETEYGIVPVDIFSKLCSHRIIFISEVINEKLSSDIVATLLLLDSQGRDKITIFLNSDAGDIRSVFTIYDTMKILKSKIEVIAIGDVFGEPVILLAGASKGMKYATKHTIICPSPVLTSEAYQTNLPDAEAILRRTTEDSKIYMKILARCSGKKYTQVSKDFERKVFMNAAQAYNYGLIDKILTK